MDLFLDHPKSVCMSYTLHFLTSLQISLLFFTSSIKAFLHAIFPFIYIMNSTTSARYILSILEKSGCRNSTAA